MKTTTIIWLISLSQLSDVASAFAVRHNSLKSSSLSSSLDMTKDSTDVLKDPDSSMPSRRQILAGVPAMMTLGFTLPACAVRIAQEPALQYLEPIYELLLSVEALQKGAKDPKYWPYIDKRLDKFFGGGIISEKNYYAGLNVQYCNQIKYDPTESKEAIQLDKDARFQAMKDTLNSMEALKKDLDSKSPDPKSVEYNANVAAESINQWFSLVPEPDTKAVKNLFVAVRKADKNNDGKLDDAEIATLSESNREVWKKRVDLVGA